MSWQARKGVNGSTVHVRRGRGHRWSWRWAVPRELAAASPRLHEACFLLPVGGRSTLVWVQPRVVCGSAVWCGRGSPLGVGGGPCLGSWLRPLPCHTRPAHCFQLGGGAHSGGWTGGIHDHVWLLRCACDDEIDSGTLGAVFLPFFRTHWGFSGPRGDFLTR